MRKHSKVIFANDDLEKAFYALPEDDEVKKYVNRAMNDIRENAFCGIQIPKKLIPDIYVKKYGIRNLWKYDLPDGWRLLYSLTTPDKIEIISIILGWFDHKNYERLMGY